MKIFALMYNDGGNYDYLCKVYAGREEAERAREAKPPGEYYIEEQELEDRVPVLVAFGPDECGDTGVSILAIGEEALASQEPLPPGWVTWIEWMS